MNSGYFKELFIHSARTFNTSWDPEGWTEVTRFRGFYQPRSGSSSFANGQVYDNLTATLYAPMSVRVKTGDRITTAAGRVFEVVFEQSSGIAGIGDHLEIGLRDVE